MLAQLLFGLVLLGTAALAGAALSERPWPNRIDAAGSEFARGIGPHWAEQVVRLGSTRAVVIGVLLLCVIAALRRDWVRVVACLIAPTGAVAIVELVAKPLVGRTYGESTALSYPSGTVTVVAALAAAALLVAPGLLKPSIAVLGAVIVAAVSVAVVVLHWHYTTDAFGGTCVGYGAVFTLDAVGHLVFGRFDGGQSGTHHHLLRGRLSATEGRR
jgi:membrane-associated phospholipid phosphatase